MNTIKNEPAVIINFATAIIIIMGAFGWTQATEEQQKVLIDNLPEIVAGVSVLVGAAGLGIRQLVTPTRKIKEEDKEV